MTATDVNYPEGVLPPRQESLTAFVWEDMPTPPTCELALETTASVDAALLRAYPELQEFGEKLKQKIDSDTEMGSDYTARIISNIGSSRRVEHGLTKLERLKHSVSDQIDRVLTSIASHPELEGRDVHELTKSVVERSVDWLMPLLHVSGEEKEALKEVLSENFQNIYSWVAEDLISSRRWTQESHALGKKIYEGFSELPPEVQFDHVLAAAFTLQEWKNAKHTEEAAPQINHSANFLLALSISIGRSPLVALENMAGNGSAKPVLAQKFMHEASLDDTAGDATQAQLHLLETMFPDIARDRLVSELARHWDDWPPSMNADFNNWIDSFRQSSRNNVSKLQQYISDIKPLSGSLELALEELELLIARQQIEIMQRGGHNIVRLKDTGHVPAGRISTARTFKDVCLSIQS